MEPNTQILIAVLLAGWTCFSLIVLVLTYKVGFNNGWHYCNKNATCLEIDGAELEEIVLKMLTQKMLDPPSPSPQEPERDG